MNTLEYDNFVAEKWMNGTEDFETQMTIAGFGLAGESGEIAEKLKKWIRGDYHMGLGKQQEVLKELGDILFYISTMARLVDSNLDYVMDLNIQKLTDRQKRTGTLRGDGDNR